jgi:hypothetical protein
MSIFRSLLISSLMLLVAQQLTYGQTSVSPSQTPPPVAPVWVRTITYGSTTENSKTTFDIHVAVPSASDPDFPCGSGDQLTLDNLAFSKENVASSDGKESRITSEDLKPTPEKNGFYYKLLVGENLPLPQNWTTLTFGVSAHCTGQNTNAYRVPSITVPRQLSIEPVQLTIKGAQPLWYRSQGNKDTVALTLNSNKPVAIKSLVIKEVQSGNRISETFTDTVQSDSRDIRFSQFLQPMAPSRQYTLEGTINDGEREAIKSVPFVTAAAALSDYTIDDIKNKEKLTVNDTSPNSSITLEVVTNDSGTLTLVFDAPFRQDQAQQRITDTSVGRTHKFIIPTAGLDDGRYSFRFTGQRATPPDSLNDPNSYSLVVNTRAELVGPVGLKMENQNISISYCLTRKISTGVMINRASTDGTLIKEKPADPGGACAGFPNAVAYKASIGVSEFARSLNPAPAPSSTPTAPALGAVSLSPQPSTQPVVLVIQDKTLSTSILSLNLDAVQLSGAQNAALATAIQTLSNDRASNPDRNSAAQTVTAILQNSGVPAASTDEIVKFFRDNGRQSRGQAILTALVGIAKTAGALYLGLPAAQ